MTNLYEFLNGILQDVEEQDKTQCGPMPVFLSTEQLDWIRNYLKPVDMLINFKATKVDEKDGEPVYAQDFQIVGEGVDVFCLLTEAMLQNHQFADQVVAAASFYKEHVPKCLDCQKRHFSVERPVRDWNFNPHKPINP